MRGIRKNARVRNLNIHIICVTKPLCIKVNWIGILNKCITYGQNGDAASEDEFDVFTPSFIGTFTDASTSAVEINVDSSLTPIDKCDKSSPTSYEIPMDYSATDDLIPFSIESVTLTPTVESSLTVASETLASDTVASETSYSKTPLAIKKRMGRKIITNKYKLL